MGPHAVQKCFENDAKMAMAGQANPDRRSCSDHSEVGELASVAILDYLFLNEDRKDNTFGKPVKTGSMGHTHVLVYIDNSGDNFRRRVDDWLKGRILNSFSQSTNICEASYTDPVHKDSQLNLLAGTQLDRRILCGGLAKSSTFYCYGIGFGKMEFNCQLPKQVKQAFKKYKTGKEFADAIKEVAGAQQVAEMVKIDYAFKKYLDKFLSRRYDCLRNHVIRASCSLR